MQPGDVVEVRSAYRGRVRWAFPHRVLADAASSSRSTSRREPKASGWDAIPDGRYLERWVRGDDPHPHVWQMHHVLSLTRRGDAHSLWHLWDEDWNFVCWQVQLQASVIERAGIVETTDQALDIVVHPDGRLEWKDEDDFAEAQALGVFTSEEAAAVRAEGERVIAAKPWPTGWEEWRP